MAVFDLINILSSIRVNVKSKIKSAEVLAVHQAMK